MHTHNADLNPEQLRAAFHLQGPLLVLAGAGSGKTRIVTRRIAHLLSLGVPPQRIAAVTFTNKAAQEMKERVRAMTSQEVLTATFHSFCVRILRESIDHLGYTKDFVIYDEEDSEKLLKEVLRQLAINEDREKVRSIRSKISQLKNQLIGEETSSEEEIFKIFALYQQKLKECNSLDFDDILFLTVRLFERYPMVLEKYQNRYEWLLIDEYQDTNKAQYMLAKLLSKKHNNLFAVGDPDQSIYSWRGANIQNILQFEKDYPGAQIVYLEQNYRSHPAILKAANALISHNTERFEKNLWSNKEEGALPQIISLEDERQEANIVVERLIALSREKDIPWNECAIFYRTNFQSRTFEDALLRHKIPYKIVGGLSFYQRREIKDLLSWLRLLLGNQDLIAFQRTVNTPRRGIGETAIANIVNYSARVSVPLLQACRAAASKDGIEISSKAVSGLREYLHVLDELTKALKAGSKISLLLEMLLTAIKYIDYLKLDAETFEERKGNVMELMSKAIEWEEDHPDGTLAQFLEELSLQTSQEGDAEETDTVKLMTLHNGKGLEFRLVFMVGMEEELFPHINARDSVGGIEEERRLCYVGMTRTKEILIMTTVERRFLWGTPRMMRPSRFLREIPSDLCSWGLGRRKSSFEMDDEDFDEDSFSSKHLSSNGEEFTEGDNVRHTAFGVGTVLRVFESSLGTTLEVRFIDGHTRTLVVKYAKLVRV